MKSLGRLVLLVLLLCLLGVALLEVYFAFDTGRPLTLGRILWVAALAGLVFWIVKKQRAEAAGAGRARKRPKRALRNDGGGDLAGHEPLHSNVLHWLLKLGALLILWGYFQVDLPDIIARNSSAMLFISAAVLSTVAKLLHWALRLRVRPLPKSRVSNRDEVCVYLRSFQRDEAGSFNELNWTNAFFGLNPNLAAADAEVSYSRMFYMANPLTVFRLLLLKSRETAEEQLLGSLARKMPVVAIGKPGEAMPTLGAQRAYVSDGEWQEAVLSAMDKASLVVIQPGESKHIIWEIDRSLERVDHGRILFWLTGLEQEQARYEVLRIHLEQKSGLKFPRHLGKHVFLAIVEGVPRMLEVVERNAFAWPLNGSRVDFRRTLAQVLPGAKPQPARVPPRGWLPRFVSSTIRKATVVSALCFWQLIGPLLCLCFLSLTGVVRESWDVWDLGRRTAKATAETMATETTQASEIKWRRIPGWKPSSIYDPNTGSHAGEQEFYGWSYGHGAFMLVSALKMTPGLASIYERAPLEHLRKDLSAINGLNGVVLGELSDFDDGGRKWVQAEFKAENFDLTWTQDTIWLRMLTAGARGIVRSTLGPEGHTLAFVFAPATSAVFAREPLHRIMESLVVKARIPAESHPLSTTPPTAEMTRGWERAEEVRHVLDKLPEFELTMPNCWARQDEKTFALGKSAVLTWSFRASEITDRSVREAAERELRSFELVEGRNWRIVKWFEYGNEGILEGESSSARLIQKTWAGPLGVVTTRAWCNKEHYAQVESLMRKAATGLRMVHVEGVEMAASNKLTALPLSHAVVGIKAPYVLHLQPGWAGADAVQGLDRLILLAEPFESTIAVTSADIDSAAKRERFAREKWQSIADYIAKNTRGEGIVSVQPRETIEFSGVAGGSGFRTRMDVQPTERGVYQQTIYGVLCGEKFYTVFCASPFKRDRKSTRLNSSH